MSNREMNKRARRGCRELSRVIAALSSPPISARAEDAKCIHRSGEEKKEEAEMERERSISIGGYFVAPCLDIIPRLWSYRAAVTECNREREGTRGPRGVVQTRGSWKKKKGKAEIRAEGRPYVHVLSSPSPARGDGSEFLTEEIFPSAPD